MVDRMSIQPESVFFILRPTGKICPATSEGKVDQKLHSEIACHGHRRVFILPEAFPIKGRDKPGIMPRQEYKSSRPRVPCNGRTDSAEILCCRTAGRKV